MKKKWIFAGLLFSVLPAIAADPPALEQTNPLGHQTLSAPDYLRFIPSLEPLTGNFVPAYTGTSELFVRGVLARLAQSTPARRGARNSCGNPAPASSR